MATEKEIRHFRRRLLALEEERKRGWEDHWRKLSKCFQPRQARFLDSGDETNRGDMINEFWDGIGIEAVDTLTGGMHTGLTSPARPWFALTLEDEDLARRENVKWWLDAVERLMAKVFAQSNFYARVNMLYTELIVFGTGSMFIEEDEDDVIRCRTLTVGEYCLDVDSRGRVDSLYRRVRMSARQIEEAWPETCPERIKKMAANDNPEWLTVVHVVEPRKGVGAGTGQRGGQRPFRSVYMLLEGRPDEVLEESGYYEFPAVCPRWKVTASDVYGSSPAMNALGDCLILQEMAKNGLKALEVEVNPPLLAMSGAGLTRISLNPGAVNFVNAMSQGGSLPVVSPLLQVRANLGALAQFKAEIKEQLKRLLFNHLFMLLSNTDKNMTATEVAERNAEKMLMMGPVLDSLRNELFQALIDRVFGIMWRRGDIPPPPPEMVEAGAGISVEFLSILAQAQKQAGLSGINTILAFVGQAAPMNPEILDKINFDEAVDQMAEMLGTPPNLVNSAEEVTQIRQQRAEQMAQQQQMAQMSQMAGLLQQGAGAAKDAGLTPEALAKAQGATAQAQEGAANA